MAPVQNSVEHPLGYLTRACSRRLDQPVYRVYILDPVKPGWRNVHHHLVLVPVGVGGHERRRVLLLKHDGPATIRPCLLLDTAQRTRYSALSCSIRPGPIPRHFLRVTSPLDGHSGRIVVAAFLTRNIVGLMGRRDPRGPSRETTKVVLVPPASVDGVAVID
jgi:hypothetical protein